MRTDSELQTASDLLRHHYGFLPPPGPPRSWQTLVAVVVGWTRAKRSGDETDTLTDGSLISSPSETAETSDADLVEYLKKVGHAKRKAAILRHLACWWLRRFGNDCESGEWDAVGTETLRHELVAIPGVSLELADRLLLFVGDLSAYPVDRAVMRVACRHGWMDASVEYDEWQSFFVQRREQERSDLRHLALWMRRLGDDFCGRAPKCEECPLRTLLPESGPYEPEM